MDDQCPGRSGAARDALEALSDRGLAISVITLGELYAGAVGRPDESGELVRVHRFLRTYALVTLTESIMLTYARLRRQLLGQGEPLALPDLLIAATAVPTNRALITSNRRHFDRIPGLRIY